MRNYSFTASGTFGVNPSWSDEAHVLARNYITNQLYVLFQTEPEARYLKYATTSEKRVLVAFRQWYLKVRRSETRLPFVYVNVNTGKSVVITILSGKEGLVDPRFLSWEDITFKFTKY